MHTCTCGKASSTYIYIARWQCNAMSGNAKLCNAMSGNLLSCISHAHLTDPPKRKFGKGSKLLLTFHDFGHMQSCARMCSFVDFPCVPASLRFRNLPGYGLDKTQSLWTSCSGARKSRKSLVNILPWAQKRTCGNGRGRRCLRRRRLR